MSNGSWDRLARTCYLYQSSRNLFIPVKPQQRVTRKKNRTFGTTTENKDNPGPFQYGNFQMRSNVATKGSLQKVGRWSADSTDSGGEELVRTQIASHPISRNHSCPITGEGEAECDQHVARDTTRMSSQNTGL